MLTANRRAVHSGWVVIGVLLAPLSSAQPQTPARAVQRIRAIPAPQVPQPARDPVDALGMADRLGFASAQRIRGDVRESGTGQPLSKVWVIAAWETWGQSGFVCFDADTVRTDDAGHFELSTWRHRLSHLAASLDQRLRLFAYRPDYELVELDRRELLMRLSQDSPAARVQALQLIHEAVTVCSANGPADDTHVAHFRPLWAEMMVEVHALPGDTLARDALLSALER